MLAPEAIATAAPASDVPAARRALQTRERERARRLEHRPGVLEARP